MRGSSVRRLCPALDHLLARINTHDLDESFLEVVATLCGQLAQQRHRFRDIPFVVESIPLVLDRVRVFENEFVEVRAHLFLDGASETFVHNHGSSFIRFASACWQA